MVHEAYWYGLLSGIAAAAIIHQVVQAHLKSYLEANRWRWRPGRYFAFKVARIVRTGDTAMYACGGQIISEPYLQGWRIVVPVTMDPHRILGEISRVQWTINPLPDAVVPAKEITVCRPQDYDLLDCDLQSRVVYLRPHDGDDKYETGKHEPSQPSTPFPENNI